MAELGIDGHKSNRSLGPLWRVNQCHLVSVMYLKWLDF